MKASSPVSMRTIAQQAGVSHVTVSLALRNDPRLPLETRQRIQAIAHELGYRPNPLVHALMAQVRTAKPVTRTTTLAFVTAFPTRDGWRKASHIFREYYEGAVERAQQSGYQIEEVWAKEPGMTGRRLTQVLLARNIRGLIIGPVPTARGHLSLDWSQFAAAALGYSMTRPDLHRAAANHYLGMTLALRKLRRLGHRRVGFAIPDSSEERVNRANLAAVLTYQRTQRPANRVPPLLMRGDWDEKAFRTWVCRYRPDAVISHAAMVALDVRRFGMRVPEDVAVMTCNGTRSAPSVRE